ncbi:hypothetical protein [Geminocystis herdmanii]|uniref:hypothetical protein n=1 Tax=Geminocystis herdmanii TaxID=669359 RepID=UPI00034A618D|nr:hypothetical protein [Geminocystis herdmanii]
MNALELRTQIQESIEQLPEEKLLVAADFLAYLAEKECGDATEELLKITGFQESFEKAKKNIEQGKVISVDQLKRKY